MNRTITVTTSWDDGHVLDLRVAELLSEYGVQGTFYVSPENREIAPEKRLRRRQVFDLSRHFEIGAHTVTHPRLSRLDESSALREIVDSKRVLEEWTGTEIRSFCYPGGDYADVHKRMVEDAGFSVARTVRRFAADIGDDPFAIPTTVHGYRHWSDVVPIFRSSGPIRFASRYLFWDRLAMSLFDDVLERGGVFHLWGHSWEIDANRQWDGLERVLRHIGGRTEVEYKTNGTLI